MPDNLTDEIIYRFLALQKQLEKITKLLKNKGIISEVEQMEILKLNNNGIENN